MRVPVTATIKAKDRLWYGGRRGKWFYYIDLINIVANDQPIPDQRFGQGIWSDGFEVGETYNFFASFDGGSISFPSHNVPKTDEELKTSRLASQKESREAKKKLLGLMTEDDLKIVKSYSGRSYGEMASFDLNTLMSYIERAERRPKKTAKHSHHPDR